MWTVVETSLFSKLWPNYWNDDERTEFAAFLAEHPYAGDVVPESGGCRKIRWAYGARGKRGGVRVVYFNLLSEGLIVLLLIHAKNALDAVPASVLRKLVKEI